MTSSCFSGENNVVYFFLFSTLESWAVWVQDVHLASYGKYLILENTCKIQSFVRMLICVHLFSRLTEPCIYPFAHSTAHRLLLWLYLLWKFPCICLHTVCDTMAFVISSFHTCIQTLTFSLWQQTQNLCYNYLYSLFLLLSNKQGPMVTKYL